MNEVPYYEKKDNVHKRQGLMRNSPKDPEKQEREELEAFGVACDALALLAVSDLSRYEGSPESPPSLKATQKAIKLISAVLQGSSYHSIWLYPNKGWALRWTLEWYASWVQNLYREPGPLKTGERCAHGKWKGMVSLNRIVFLDGDALFFCQEGIDYFATNRKHTDYENSSRYKG
jgi:hypothetical protein